MSVGVLQAQSAAAPPPAQFGFDASWDLLSSDALGNMGAKLGAYTGVTIIPLASNPFVPPQNEIVALGTTQVFTMAAGTTLTAFKMSFQKAGSPTKHKVATLSTANPNLNFAEYDHIVWKTNGNHNSGQDAPLVIIGGGFGDGVDDPDEGGIGGGGIADPLNPLNPLNPVGPGPVAPGPVASPSVDIDLITLMNTNTGAMTVPLFWLWIEGGLTGQNAPGQTIKAVFEATDSAGATISTEKTWVTQ